MTLTQVLLEQDQMLVYGQQVSDFYLRGDLGLGLDPEGPVGFAWIHAFKPATGSRCQLAVPLLLSVHGPGEPHATPVTPGERCWRVYRDAGVVQMVPSRWTWAECLASNRAERADGDA